MEQNYDFSQAFDGKRLTRMMRASVQRNGHLNFPPEAGRQLGLSLEKSLLICPMGTKDMAVTVVDKDNERGFMVKKTGPYFYVPLKSLLNECEIDYVNNTVVYDIIELNDKYEGRPVFKFNRRIIPHVKAAPAEAAAAVEPEAAAPVAEGDAVTTGGDAQ